MLHHKSVAVLLNHAPVKVQHPQNSHMLQGHWTVIARQILSLACPCCNRCAPSTNCLSICQSALHILLSALPTQSMANQWGRNNEAVKISRAVQHKPLQRREKERRKIDRAINSVKGGASAIETRIHVSMHRCMGNCGPAAAVRTPVYRSNALLGGAKLLAPWHGMHSYRFS